MEMYADNVMKAVQSVLLMTTVKNVIRVIIYMDNYALILAQQVIGLIQIVATPSALHAQILALNVTQKHVQNALIINTP